MRIYKILFFLIAVFFLSCNNKKEEAGILSHDEMQAVLIDVHIVDGSMFETSGVPDSMYKYGTAKYQQVFKMHHTDSAQFKKSFRYYTNKPDQLYDIYDKVVAAIKIKADSAARIKTKADSLENIRQQKINAQIAKRAADSIARINKIKADSLAKKKAKAGAASKAKKLKKKNAVSRK